MKEGTEIMDEFETKSLYISQDEETITIIKGPIDDLDSQSYCPCSLRSLTLADKNPRSINDGDFCEQDKLLKCYENDSDVLESVSHNQHKSALDVLPQIVSSTEKNKKMLLFPNNHDARNDELMLKHDQSNTTIVYDDVQQNTASVLPSVSQNGKNLNQRKVSRAFSVVPVQDLKCPPNTNLQNFKKRMREVSEQFSSNDSIASFQLPKRACSPSAFSFIKSAAEDGSSLSSNTQSHESQLNVIAKSSPKKMIERNSSIPAFCHSCHGERGQAAATHPVSSRGDVTSVPIPSLIPSITVTTPANTVFPLTFAPAPVAPGIAIASPAFWTAGAGLASSAKTVNSVGSPIMTIATPAIHDTLSPHALGSSVNHGTVNSTPSHVFYNTILPVSPYDTFCSVPLSPHFNTLTVPGSQGILNNDSHYFTIQPSRPVRGITRNQSLNFAAQKSFLTKNDDGSSMMDLGSTDGRNLKFDGALKIPNIPRDIISLDSVRPNNTLKSLDNIKSISVISEEFETKMSVEKLSERETEILKASGQPSDSDEEKGGKIEYAEKRLIWTSKFKYLLACIGSCVGLGNFWRFPYLCYKSGGGAFLIPYFTMLIICGFPLLLMEMAVGQYTRQGPIGALNALCPIFCGSAIGVVIISVIFSSYYNVIISWSIYYLFLSFHSILPWTVTTNSEIANFTTNGSVTQDFFYSKVLLITEGIDVFGGIVWPLFGCVLLAWAIVYFSIFKSIKSSGMVVLVTATAPYVLIFIFLVRAVTLDGAGEGLRFLFSPNWSLLLDVDVWVNAAAQNFNSLGIAFGSMITYPSYNKFNNNVLYDVWIVATINACTSLLAGIIVFSTIGNIAFETGKNITDVVTEGPGLAFVVYPQALGKMPLSNFFSFLFFFMLIILGIDSQFATVEVIVTSLKDSICRKVKHELLVFSVCVFCFIVGLIYICEGGMYFFALVDYYATGISLMYLAFFEVIGVVWCYGANNLCLAIKEMTGKLPSAYYKYCWLILSPLLIAVIAVFHWCHYSHPTYDHGRYHFPTWAIALGWFIAFLSIVPIPIVMVIQIWNAPGKTLYEKIKICSKPRLRRCKLCRNTMEHPERQCQCRSYVDDKDYKTKRHEGISML